MRAAVPSVPPSSPGEPPFAPPWLVRLLPRLPGARCLALVGAEGLRRWPADAAFPAGTRELARRARLGGRIVRAVLPAAVAGIEELLAIPLPGVDEARGEVVVIGARTLDEPARVAIVRRVRSAYGGAAPAHAPEAGIVEAGRVTAMLATRLAPVVLDAVAAHGGARAAALALADATASFGDCRRVSVGLRRRGRTCLLAISGEARPDARRALTRTLAARVEETLARGAGTRCPGAAPGPSGVVPARAHGRAGASGRIDADPDEDGQSRSAAEGMAWCSVLRAAPGGVSVVAVLERDAGQGFDAATHAGLERALSSALALTGVLEHGAKGTAGRFLDATRDGIGGAHRAARGALLLLALTGATLVPLPYAISGRVLIEASDRQVLTAPRDGHIRSAHARAGDEIAAGELLASLDERELVLAHDKWDSEMAKNRAEQAGALATRDRVELTRLRVDATRIAAELALVAERRARGELRAPFDGVVLSGDPTRSLGAPVKAGEVLFEVASGARRSLLIEIDEHDVALIETGGEARVRMAAEPGRVRRARLDPLLPVAVAEPGGSVFRVPATLLDGDAEESLRPGMQGVARVAAGRRSLASAWTRAARERLLLFGWKLGLLR